MEKLKQHLVKCFDAQLKKTQEKEGLLPTEATLTMTTAEIGALMKELYNIYGDIRTSVKYGLDESISWYVWRGQFSYAFDELEHALNSAHQASIMLDGSLSKHKNTKLYKDTLTIKKDALNMYADRLKTVQKSIKDMRTNAAEYLN